MKKYKFNLQSVLDIRTSIEEVWEAKLSHINSQCDLIRNKIESHSNEIKNLGLTGYNIEVTGLYKKRLSLEIEKQEALLKEKMAERDEIQRVYMEKSRDKKIIEKIKDKSLDSYKKEFLRDEVKFIDEINSAQKLRQDLIEGVR